MSPANRWWTLAAALASIGVSLVSLFFALLSTPRVPGLAALIVGGVWLIALLVAARVYGPMARGFVAVAISSLPLAGLALYDKSAPSRDDLRAFGEPTVDAIKRFREREGRYPANLSEAGAELPLPTRFGAWRYESLSESSCQLSVGDYSIDPFVVFWSSRSGWGVDS